ncbi:MAG: ABC transporter ATP-binding protein [Candidatus Manganitrophaceae bacterium]|nr:MAG: ABC transporter ATP-binding protein [Candidatus Manganitrophaceae bacterium]
MPEPILQVQQLKTYFYLTEGIVPAVEEVRFDLSRGETLGLVGESGSGKSVTALSILRLVPDPPGKIVGGRILFEGKNLLDLSEKEMRKIRGNRISMIFQEPMTSLNPVLTIGEQIAEGIVLHEKVGKKEAMNQSIEMLRKVEIPAPERRIREYPHQLSGGMRQRVMIAMALALRPAILIADEPTTALDVTIQRQILDLIRKLQEEIGMAVLLITHNLGIIAETAQRVVVMKEGRVVETADVFSLFEKPQHPYTQQLLAAVPRLGETKRWTKKRGSRSQSSVGNQQGATP